MRVLDVIEGNPTERASERMQIGEVFEIPRDWAEGNEKFADRCAKAVCARARACGGKMGREIGGFRRCVLEK